MPKQPDLLDRYIEAQKASITIAPYQDTVTSGAFKGRTAGYWGGMGIGLTWGTLVGGVLAAALPVFGVEQTGANILKVVGALGAIGIVSGGTAGQIIGASAGAASAAVREKERREKSEALEVSLRRDPPAQEVMEAFMREAQQAGHAGSSKDKGSANTVGDVIAQSGGIGGALKKLVNFKVMAVAALGGAVLGAVLALGGQSFANSLGVSLLGKEAGTGALAALGALGGGLSGISFGIGMPWIFTSSSKFSGRVLSGKVFEPQQAQAKAPSLEAAPAVAEERVAEPLETNHAARLSKQPGFESYREFLHAQETNPAAGRVLH